MSDLKPTLIALNIAMPILATIVVLLRIQARRLSNLSLGYDDYLVVAALFFTICFAVDSILAVVLGNLGGHLRLNPDGSPEDFDQLVLFQKLVLAAQILSVPAEGLSKLSVLFFYKRIFRGKTFELIVTIMVWIVVFWNIGFIFANLLYCVPIQKDWDGKTGDCLNTVALFASITVTDVLTDVIILSLPISQIWKLHLPLARKVQIGFIFLLGSFVVFTGIARCILPTSGIAGRGSDSSYQLAPTDYWTITEASVGVVSACLPTLRPIYLHYGTRRERNGSSYLRKLTWTPWKSLRKNANANTTSTQGSQRPLVDTNAPVIPTMRFGTVGLHTAPDHFRSPQQSRWSTTIGRAL